MVVKWDPTEPSNWRAAERLTDWLTRRGRIGIGGIDTRRLTRAIRQQGAPHVALAHDPEGKFDIDALVAKARAFTGLVGLDLAKGRDLRAVVPLGRDALGLARGLRAALRTRPPRCGDRLRRQAQHPALPRLRGLRGDGPARDRDGRGRARAGTPRVSSCRTGLATRRPPGVCRADDPWRAAARGCRVFGICLGHQMLALALGATTIKMNHGHHGANHPVKDVETGKVEITSMNHGFTVDSQTLPEGVIETHVSLFDGSNCGIRMADRPVFSVQYHPEASPGPQDSYYLFERFAAATELLIHP
jgi:carbamoyl-phosphate synthase small subunit